jgi:hypothetical protein
MVLILLGGLLLRWFEIGMSQKTKKPIKPRKNNQKTEQKNRLKFFKKISVQFGSVLKT